MLPCAWVICGVIGKDYWRWQRCASHPVNKMNSKSERKGIHRITSTASYHYTTTVVAHISCRHQSRFFLQIVFFQAKNGSGENGFSGEGKLWIIVESCERIRRQIYYLCVTRWERKHLLNYVLHLASKMQKEGNKGKPCHGRLSLNALVSFTRYPLSNGNRRSDYLYAKCDENILEHQKKQCMHLRWLGYYFSYVDRQNAIVTRIFSFYSF